MGVVIQFPAGGRAAKSPVKTKGTTKNAAAVAKAETVRVKRKPKGKKLKRVEYPDVVVVKAGPLDEDLEEMVGALTIESHPDGVIEMVTFDPLPDDVENWYTDEVGEVVHNKDSIVVHDLHGKCRWHFEILTDDEDD